MKEYILAHATEVSHEEDEAADVAAVDPVYLGGAALFVLIIGFLVWKFVIRKHG